MIMPLWHHSLFALPTHCFPRDDFLENISSSFGTCVPTYPALISVLLGSLSILSWLFAQLPQIYKNYKLQSTAGLSIYFLLEWCLGDTTNLVGAILTRQATWQVMVAAYYTAVDCALVGQYFYYMRYIPWREERSSGGLVIIEAPDDDEDDVDFYQGIRRQSAASVDDLDFASGKLSSEPRDIPPRKFRFPNDTPPREKATQRTGKPIVYGSGNSLNMPGPSPKMVLLVSMLCVVLTRASPVPSPEYVVSLGSEESPTEILGRVVSWVSTALYLGSRLPQIWKNYSRQSTAGLSPALFAAAFCGNFFYSASLLTNPLAWNSYPPYGLDGWVGEDGSDRATWVALATPFFLGAAGVLALDAAVGVQFLMYEGTEESSQVIQIKDSRGRNQSRKVSGWMRGWVPSPSRTLVVSRERVDSRPLLERDSLDNVTRDYGSA